MYDNVFQPQRFPTYPYHSRSSSYQDEAGLIGEAYPLRDQGTKNSIPRRTQSGEEQSFPYPTTHLSIPRKLIGYSSGSTSSVDQRGPYQHLGPVVHIRKHQGANRFELLWIWWLELLCCVLFIGALVAVVLTVRPYEGRPLPQWPYRLSINSLISVYIVILKAAVLLVAAEGLSQLKWRWFDHGRPLKDLLSYDDASRGPWGSLTLLWRLRGRQLVSSCGAFITVAALIIDPFAQQVIATYDCRIPAEAVVAMIPRTNDFEESGPHTGAGLSPVTLGMQNSINAGIFNPGRSVAFDCPTGNCTFPTNYHTVGYCSECNDTTNKLYIESEPNGNTSTKWTITLPAADSSTSANISAIMSAQSSSGNSHYLLMKSIAGQTDVIVGNMISNQSGSCTDTCPSLEEQNYDKCNENWNDVKWGCTRLSETGSTIGAASCSLFPCIRTYTAAVDGGQWKERLVSVAKEWGRATTLLASMVDVECLNELDRNSLADAGYDFEGKFWIPYNLSIDHSSGNYSTGNSLNTNVTTGAVSAKCVYQHGAIAANSIGYFVGGFLNGTIVPGSYSYDYQGPVQLQAIYNNANITFERINETWWNISDSITTYMRQNGAENFSAPAIGQAFRGQTCVHIQWLFLAYPAALVLLAIIFFVCMVFETRRGEVSRLDWKSSPLALLFHGLDRQAMSSEELAELTRESEMERIAEHTSVRLIQRENGWQFVRMRMGQ